LTKLEMTDFCDEQQILDLAACIPVMRSLRTLNMGYVSVDIKSMRPILIALRENGTLTSTVLNYSVRSATKLAEAYAKRNQFLEESLLLKSTSLEADNCPDTGPMVDDTVASLHPTLMEVAKQIPATRASVLVFTLCQLGDSIGGDA
jgi:hypothetical protein